MLQYEIERFLLTVIFKPAILTEVDSAAVNRDFRIASSSSGVTVGVSSLPPLPRRSENCFESKEFLSFFGPPSSLLLR